MVSKIFNIIIISIFLTPSTSFTQQNYHENLLRTSNNLYSLGYYSSSLQYSLFYYDILNSYNLENAKSNLILNSLRLNDTWAEKRLKDFELEYPGSTLKEKVVLDLANYYFDNQEYRYALKWFSKIKESQLEKREIPKFNFNKGYSLFSAKRYKLAKPFFEKVKNVKKFKSDANYYLGHISYQLEDFDSAVKSFENVSKIQQKQNLNYFQVDINFRLGRFEKAIKLGEKELESTTESSIRSELSKIIGESYFNIEKYDDAIKYLSKYDGKNGKWTNTDLYQLGFAFYKTNNFKKAINHFNKIIGSNDEISQSAYYYLADSYFNSNQKSAALNAFKKASQMTFNKTISEDALLNYSKLSYEIGNPFEQVSEVLIFFIDKYPKNIEHENISNLLIDSYTKQKNYDAALSILKENNFFSNKDLIQKLNYLKAVELFSLRKFEDASYYFEEVFKSGNNDYFEIRAKYWLGRSNFELKNFDDALENYKDFLNKNSGNYSEEFKRVNYDLAYTYFKLEEYSYALSFFEEFTIKTKTDSSLYNDSLLRIGDCNFALKKYWPAIDFYKKIIDLKLPKAPYAIFQAGICYGFLDRSSKKTELLEYLFEIYPNSSYSDDALFELANVLSAQRDYVKSNNLYDKLAENYKNSPHLLKSKLNKALILYNQGNYDDSKNILRSIVIENPTNSISQQALNVLREIAIDLGEVNEFSKWLKTNKISIYSNTELEKNAFKSAEKQYLNNNKKQAVKLFKSYLLDYPYGLNYLQVVFYLAEIFYDQDFFNESKSHYELILSENTNQFSEKALVRIIQILKNKNELISSIPYLEKLYKIAEFEENKKFSELNLMQGYFKNKNYEKSILFASKAIEDIAVEDKFKWDALVIKARSSLMLKDTIQAMDAYQKLETIPDSDIVSEALFFKAQKLNLNKDYLTSNKVITKISNQSTNSSIWATKSLLLLSENYFLLDDTFQATFILESIIENFKQYPEIVSEANQLLIEYKEKASKENSSINDIGNDKE
jgi:tetratricopeptide (TPR) repeat protein